MGNPLIGRGWAFPPQLNGQGGVAMVEDVDEIKQSIEMILSTAQGERVMRPAFGSQLHELVFEPINLETMALARKYVFDALSMWEPRIRLLDVQVRDPYESDPFDATQEGELLIELKYQVNANEDPRSLVYPFYLIPGE